MFFFKQKTAYEMRISDWSSDVCSSDLHEAVGIIPAAHVRPRRRQPGVLTENLEQAIVVERQIMRMDAVVMFLHPAAAGQLDRAVIEFVQRFLAAHQIGRASCRESVCQSV